MEIIPLRAIPNQTVIVRLQEQVTQLNVYQKPQGLFIDVLVNNEPVVMGVICQDRNAIVRDAYLGFVGDLAFLDNEGNDDPDYTGLGGAGSRFSLAYLPPEE